MSDYYNGNENQYYTGYGTPSQPPQPQQPPQAPPMQNNFNTPSAPPVQPPYNNVAPPPVHPHPTDRIPPMSPEQAPPMAPAPQAPVQTPPPAPVRNIPAYNQRQQAPNTPPYQAPTAPAQQQYYENSPYAPKQPMGAGLKALLIIIITFLVVSLVAFIAYVSLSPSSNSGFVPSVESTKATESMPFGGYQFGTEDDEDVTAPSTGNYEESNAKDKTDKNYKGLALNKKPIKSNEKNKGSHYAFTQVEKSVVGIIAYVDGQKGTSESYSGMGTGIIATSDGYIVTNAHLVDYSRTAYKYKVITNDKKEYKAGIVGYDSRSDLAVLKIDAKGLKPASFGDSSQIEVTEDVIVVGNPLSLNYQNSVTKGIVSAVDRQVSITNNDKCIQTDAAINPGNSGGPLCNMYGQVIGITNSKIALDDYEGMGFAIPSKLVKKITDDIIKYSYVKNRVKIGIIGEVNFIDDTYKTGIEVKEISKGGPMDGSGIKVGDFITKFENKDVANFADIYNILENYKAGDKVKVKAYRPSDGKEHEFEITLQEDKN